MFANPEPGTVGSLQRRYFSGPWTFKLDMSLMKKVEITEAANLEFAGRRVQCPQSRDVLVGRPEHQFAGFRVDQLHVLRRRDIMQFGMTLSF